MRFLYSQIVILGIAVSAVMTELTGLSAGLVVPGYIALGLHSPKRILLTMLTALVALIICRLLDRVMLLYGRRRFAVMVICAYLVGCLFSYVPLFPLGMHAIGSIVPGIIGLECDKQGIFKTILVLLADTLVVAMIMLVAGYPLLG